MDYQFVCLHFAFLMTHITIKQYTGLGGTAVRWSARQEGSGFEHGLARSPRASVGFLRMLRFLLTAPAAIPNSLR